MIEAIKQELDETLLTDEYISELTDKVVRNLVKSVKKVAKEEIHKACDLVVKHHRKLICAGVALIIIGGRRR